MFLRVSMALVVLVAGLLTVWGAGAADQVVVALVGIGLLVLVLAQGYELFVARLLMHGAVVALLLWKWAGGCGSCTPLDGWDHLLGVPLEWLGLGVHVAAALTLVASRLVRPGWRSGLLVASDLLMMQALAAALVFSVLLLWLRLLCLVCIATHAWAGVVGIRVLWNSRHRWWLLGLLLGSCAALGSALWVHRRLLEHQFQQQITILTDQPQTAAHQQPVESTAPSLTPGAVYVFGQQPRAQVWLFTDAACPGCRGGWEQVHNLLSGIDAPVEVLYLPLVQGADQMERALAVGALSLACSPDAARWALERIHSRPGVSLSDLVPPRSRITHVAALRQAMHQHGPALRVWLESARTRAREHGVRRLPTLVICDANEQRIALFQEAQVSRAILEAIVRRATMREAESE